MTVIVAKLDPSLAKRVAKAADLLKLKHEEFAVEAIRLFVRSLIGGPGRRRAARPRRRTAR